MLLITALLEAENVMALSAPVFLNNHYLRLYVVIAQIGLTLLALVLPVLKPGRVRTIPQQA